MLKVVVDSNVIISGLTAAAGNPHNILEAWRRGEIILLTCPAIVEEIAEVLGRPFFRDRRHITEEDVSRARRVLEMDATMVVPRVPLDVVEDDPDDDRVLECALEGSADYIVSGDHHLLDLRRFRHIPILTPRQFLAILEARDASQ